MKDSEEVRKLKGQLAERDSLLRWASDVLEVLGKGELVRKRIDALSTSAAPSAPNCCTPTAEEKSLIAGGDYRPEELWGGSRPTCPKCVKSWASAPVEIDERAAFEAWYIRDVGPGLANLSRMNTGSRAYEEDDAMSAWEGWQARAALERKP